MTQNLVKYIIFVVMLTTVPVFIYLAVIVGFTPVVSIIPVASSISSSLPNGSSVYVLAIPHVLVYGLVFYFLSKLISIALFKIKHEQFRYFIIFVVIAPFFVLGLFPFYWIGGHGTPELFNLYDFYFKFI